MEFYILTNRGIVSGMLGQEKYVADFCEANRYDKATTACVCGERLVRLGKIDYYAVVQSWYKIPG